MVVRNVRILNSAVDTNKIAADTVIPADVDETADFNFSSNSSTWAGILNYKNSSGSVFSTGAGYFQVATIAAASGSITNLTADMTVTANKTIDGVDIGGHIHTGGTFGGLLTTGWSSQTSTFAGAISSTAQGAAINFTSASGTFAGRIIGLIDGSSYTAGTAIVEALNISSASGTFAGIATGGIKGVLDNSHWTAGTAIVEALNISATGSTFAGRITGLADGISFTAGTELVMALNLSSASGTFAGVATGTFAGTWNESSTFTGVVNSTDTASTIGNIGLDLVAKTTAANNFTSVGSTFVGVINSTDTTSTLGKIMASLEVSAAEVAAAVGATVTTVAWSNNYVFSGVPKVTLGLLNDTSTSEAAYISTVSASSVAITVAAAMTAATYNVIGVYGY